MTDRGNITIVLLCASATLLAVACIFLAGAPDAAAAGPESRSGDYLAAVCRVSSSSDFVFVVDLSAEKMTAYAVGKDRDDRQLYLVPGTQVDLRRAFDEADGLRRPAR